MSLVTNYTLTLWYRDNFDYHHALKIWTHACALSDPRPDSTDGRNGVYNKNKAIPFSSHPWAMSLWNKTGNDQENINCSL